MLTILVFVPYFIAKFSEFDSGLLTFLVMIYLLVFLPKNWHKSLLLEKLWKNIADGLCRCLFWDWGAYPDGKTTALEDAKDCVRLGE